MKTLIRIANDLALVNNQRQSNYSNQTMDGHHCFPLDSLFFQKDK